MQVSSSTSTGVQSSQGSNRIAALQKQLRQLTDELKDVATMDMEPKAKQERLKLLQAQIQMVQQQIAAIQRQQQQEQLSQQNAQAARQAQAAEHKTPRTPGLGESVDVYA